MGGPNKRKFNDDQRESPHADAVDERLKSLYADVEFFDDVNGGQLNKELVVQARKLEMAFFQKMGVYTKEDRSEDLMD